MSDVLTGHHHDHDHDHDHDHGHERGAPSPGWRRRLIVAGVLAAAALAASVLTIVRSGDAAVVTRLGAPVRVITAPGLAIKLPAPIERVRTVDLRTRTTSTGLHGVLTKDGLSIVVQAAATWQVPADADAVQRFIRATGNDHDRAAALLRNALSSALETVSGRFALAELVNTDGTQVRLPAFESALAEAIAAEAARLTGVATLAVAVERLALPPATVAATVQRMSEERRTAAEKVMAEGRRQAGEIRAEAERDARIAKAQAFEEAARIEAAAKAEAAAIYGAAHAKDPQLYAWLRGLDTIADGLPAGSRLVLRTDAAPLRALVEGPPVAAPAASGSPTR